MPGFNNLLILMSLTLLDWPQIDMNMIIGVCTGGNIYIKVTSAADSTDYYHWTGATYQVDPSCGVGACEYGLVWGKRGDRLQGMVLSKGEGRAGARQEGRRKERGWRVWGEVRRAGRGGGQRQRGHGVA